MSWSPRTATYWLVVCRPFHGLHHPVMERGQVRRFTTPEEAEECAAFMRRAYKDATYAVEERQ